MFREPKWDFVIKGKKLTALETEFSLAFLRGIISKIRTGEEV